MNTQRENEKGLVIAFHADGITAGGLGAFIRHLASEFTERGHTVKVLVNQPGPFLDEMSKLYDVYCLDQPPINNPGINLGPLRIPNPVSAVGNMWTISKNRTRLVKTLREASPDIILGNGLFSAATFGSSCSKAGIPLVLCIHGIGKRGNDLFSMRARIAARFLNSGDAVVGVSKTCLERYKPFLTGPVSTIYNCCPPVETSELKSGFLAEHGLASDTVVFGSFGRIMPGKGYHIMLKALAEVSRKHNAVAVVGGRPLNDGESRYLDELKTLARELEIEQRCFFVGEVTPGYFFSLIDIFCHTYLGEENLSYAILEAMSAGCPVIAVNRGGPTEMISDPESGQLIPSGDPQALAGAIVKYIESPDYARKTVENGLIRIQEKFNFSRWPDNWLDLLVSHTSR